MDELLKNYIKHIGTNFSPNLKEELNEILFKGLNNEYPLEEIESRIQNRLIQFYESLKGNEFEKTAKNLFEAYVDHDDENLIRSVRFLIRMYSKFLNIKLAKYFCNWRIKAAQLKKQENNNEVRELFNKQNLINESYKNRNDFKMNNNFENNNYKENKNKDYSNKFEINKELQDKYYNIDIPKNYNTINNEMMSPNLNQMNKEELKLPNNMNVKKTQSILNSNHNYINAPKNKQKEDKKINSSFNSNHNNNSVGNYYSGYSPSNKKNVNFMENNNDRKSNSKLGNKDDQRNQMKSEKQKKEKSGAQSVTIFDKLFLESYKKNDEKLLNEEIKKLSELDECTFQPNVNKRGIL